MFGVFLLNVWSVFAECLECKCLPRPFSKGLRATLKVLYKGVLKFIIKGVRYAHDLFFVLSDNLFYSRKKQTIIFSL
ncbi:hypothetical protein DRF69_16845 [Chryseobacterium sp. 5_R23647]|nr:hypothetical protein DRF69_16845 [Chryseobacterium sp. 5_R23647]